MNETNKDALSILGLFTINLVYVYIMANKIFKISNQIKHQCRQTVDMA